MFAIYLISNIGYFSKHRLEIKGEQRITTKIHKPPIFIHDYFSSITIKMSLPKSYVTLFEDNKMLYVVE